MTAQKTGKVKFGTALKKGNSKHGKTVARLGRGIDKDFSEQVDDFIEQYRSALKRLAEK